MSGRDLPLALLLAVSWIGGAAAQPGSPVEQDAGPEAAAGVAADDAETQAEPSEPTDADAPVGDAPDAVEGGDPEVLTGPPEPPPDVVEIGDGLYVLPYCGNATLRVTPLGVVLVGDDLGQYRTEITRLLATVTERRIAYEVDPHRPGGDADPVAPNARRLAPARDGTPRLPGDPTAVPPDLVFSARLSLFLGDAEVRLHHVGGGRADGHAVAVFPDRGAVHAGDIVVEGAPHIDYAAGGSARGWIESLNALLALAFDTVIPGDGPVLLKSDALVFRDRLVTLRTRIEQLARRGIAREDVAEHLETRDIGWLLDPDGDFVRETLPGLYDEVTAGP